MMSNPINKPTNPIGTFTTLPSINGVWRDGVQWSFFTSTDLPSDLPITAVGAVTIVEDSVILVRSATRQGWESPGGHVEPCETVEQALRREVLEESGVKIRNFNCFGYTKVTRSDQVINKSTDAFYPLLSCIPHHLVYGDKVNTHPLTADVTELKSIPLNHLESIHALSLKPYALHILRAGLMAHLLSNRSEPSYSQSIIRWLQDTDVESR